jgi:membrane-anchored glycerophosphoryl diester phosphodiesterase (GDPDase)
MLILGTTILFLGLVIFMVDLIQDYLNNEFEECNTIIVALIPLLFDSDWTGVMQLFYWVTSPQMLMSLHCYGFCSRVEIG